MDMGMLGSYTAGLLTFLTPCVLPLIPIYLSMLLGGALPQSGAEQTRWKLFGHTLVFSLGFLIVFVVLGLSATAIGRLVGSYREYFTLFGGLLIFLFGLKFIGVLQIDWMNQDKRLDSHKLNLSSGLLNSLVMGVVFAFGWTPCVGPILGAVLTYTASTTSSLWLGASYLALYGLGFATPLLAASLAAETLLPAFRKLMKWLPKLEKGTGALLAGVGVYVMLGVIQVPQAQIPKGKIAISSQNAYAKALQSEQKKQSIRALQPKMIEFVSSHCPICRQMIPTVAALEQECARKQKLVGITKIDVSLPQNQAIAKAYRIRGVPTFVFLDARGQETARLIGFQRLQTLRQSLSLLTGEKCRGVGRLKSISHQKKAVPEKMAKPKHRSSQIGGLCLAVPSPKVGSSCSTNKKGSLSCGQSSGL